MEKQEVFLSRWRNQASGKRITVRLGIAKGLWAEPALN